MSNKEVVVVDVLMCLVMKMANSFRFPFIVIMNRKNMKNGANRAQKSDQKNQVQESFQSKN